MPNHNDLNLLNTSDRLEYLARKKSQRPLTRKERDEIRRLRSSHVPHLLMRSYHLPGFDYWADLKQYLVNNHPVFGICCHHKLHPIGVRVRIISLVGSVLFGLAVTNIIYLGFAFSSSDYDKSYYQYQANFTTGSAAIDDNVAGVEVSNGNIALWTVGGAMHALYDHVIWEMASCSCFMEQGISRKKIERYQSTGVYFVIVSVIVATGLATFAVALRASIESGKGDDVKESEIHMWKNDGETDLSFINSYFVELVLTFFFYYPVIGFLLFTGWLGCKRIPVLGGRPYEIMIEEREKEDEAVDAFGGEEGNAPAKKEEEKKKDKPKPRAPKLNMEKYKSTKSIDTIGTFDDIEWDQDVSEVHEEEDEDKSDIQWSPQLKDDPSKDVEKASPEDIKVDFTKETEESTKGETSNLKRVGAEMDDLVNKII